MIGYTLPALYDRARVTFYGPDAAVWFDGGPGVMRVECEGLNPFKSPDHAIKLLATDRKRWDLADRLIDTMEDYVLNVALAALRGDEQARQIAQWIITGWNVIEVDGVPLRALYERVKDGTDEWRYEVKRLRRFAVMDAIADAVHPLKVKPAIGRGDLMSDYALIYWYPDRAPLPVCTPFPFPDDPASQWELIKEGAYRYAWARWIANRRDYTMSPHADPTFDVLDRCELTAEERRCLLWARNRYSIASMPYPPPKVVEIANEVLTAIRNRLSYAD